MKELFKKVLRELRKKMIVTNRHEYRIMGMQRSGNHPIINWIWHQMPEKKIFLNYVKPGKNPFTSFEKQSLFIDPNLYKKINLEEEKIGLLSHKDYLVYSYEDIDINMISSRKNEKLHDAWLGRSGKIYDVLILRDPYNLFASRLKKEDDTYKLSLTCKRDYKKIRELWIQHAKEFIGETKKLRNRKVVINYNKWVQSKKYRDNIAKQLGLKNNPESEETLNEVPGFGGGSSFDRLILKKNAKKMQVFDRWKNYSSNDLYKKIIKDKDLQNYGKIIFGMEPII